MISLDFQPIPSFEEYCAWAKNQSLFTNVELKTSIIYYPEIEEKTIALIRKYGLEDRIIFSSFNHLSILRMKELAPEIPCGALVGDRGLKYAGFYCATFLDLNFIIRISQPDRGGCRGM